MMVMNQNYTYVLIPERVYEDALGICNWRTDKGVCVHRGYGVYKCTVEPTIAGELS